MNHPGHCKYAELVEILGVIRLFRSVGKYSNILFFTSIETCRWEKTGGGREDGIGQQVLVDKHCASGINDNPITPSRWERGVVEYLVGQRHLTFRIVPC